MNKKLIIPSGEVGDKIIQAYKDAGYKIKKSKPKKVKITIGNGILNQIKDYKYTVEDLNKAIKKYLKPMILKKYFQ